MNEPVWFRQNRDASDRFAALLDDAPAESAEFADELAVVGMLRDLGSEPVLSAPAKDRMRAALMLEARATPLALAHETEPEHVPARRIGPPSNRTRRKASLLAAATAAGVVAFGALGIELAQTALPGDLLYDVKRTTETIALDLTFSENGRALKQLDMAATRVDELAALTERDAADGGASVDDIDAYRSVIADLSSTAAAASRGVTTYGPQSDGSDLRTLRDWARAQAAELEQIQPAVPEAVVHEFNASVDLIRAIEERAVALLARWECMQITTGRTDRIGALPAEEVCQPLDPGAGPAFQPRASKSPVVDEDSSKAGQQQPSNTASDADGTDGSVGEEPDAPDADAPTGTNPPPVDVPKLPTAPDLEEPETDTDTGLQVPLLTDLPDIDMGIG